jgi:hypothetical protein
MESQIHDPNGKSPIMKKIQRAMAFILVAFPLVSCMIGCNLSTGRQASVPYFTDSLRKL